MKKILWVCDIPLPDIQNLIGIKNYNGGWLIGISNQLRKRGDIDFYYAFPQKKSKKNIEKTINGINFLGFYDGHRNFYQIDKENFKNFKNIIRKINPDIIHIFGTEFPHALECVYSVPKEKRNRIVVSTQGLVSECARNYALGIPFKDRLAVRFNDNKYCCILRENYEFHKRGINEIKILRNVVNIIGRTDWDKKCVMSINQGCNYYHCNEILRDVFYEDTWNIKNIQRHSIFVSQANYSIKGFHFLIYALPYIKRRYPDVVVYVAGKKASVEGPYGHYIQKIMKKMKVENNIRFLGYLKAEKMKQWLLRVHVMLLPSTIENSPNSVGEAMLLGTPVVASDVGGIPSILKNGTDGYLYSLANTDELVNKVCKIFASDKTALMFSKNGKKTASFLYSKEKNSEQLTAIYNEIVNR